MSSAELFRLALGALTGHRLRSLLSLLGVAIGVAAVILLTALGEGARRYVIDQFASIGTNLLVVLPGRTETTGAVPGQVGVPNDLTLDDALAVERLTVVSRVAPISMATESVAHGELRRQVAVIGTTYSYLEIRDLTVARGSFLPRDEMDRGAPVVVLGAKTAEELFPGGQNPVGAVVRIGAWRTRVIGVMGPMGTQLGIDLDQVALVPVATAMRMFNRTSLFRLMISVSSHTELDGARDRIEGELAERHGELDVTVLTEDALVSTFSAILTALTLALGAIAAISLSVAGLGIMNVMLVSVSERTSEVGLLRAVGVARGQITALFLTEAALLSACGGLTGLAIGWGAVRLLVKLFPALPASPPVWAVVAALAISLLVGVVFGLLPARQAARLDPVAALGKK